MQGVQRAWVAEPGSIERSLIALAKARSRAVEHAMPHVHRARNALARSRFLRLLLWALTLRLPGEFGYWLRARRLRGGGLPRRRGRMFLARSARPTVSVVIPSFGQVKLTLRCLAAIAAAPPAASLEVIVVDDCSADPGLARLRRVRGLRLVSTERRMGFIGAANYGAALARGELLLFLNNDAFVRPGAIDALADTLRVRPEAGAAGAKLIYPDGRLQEAGGVIWRDGSGCNVGRYDDPAKPAYNYLREADYCSAAALMVRRELFAGLGGFDPHFAPAYYEDTDLCFRLRAKGFLVLYQPLAEVVHIEGASHGTDRTRGVKAHQETNRAKFAERWAEVLEAAHLPPGSSPVWARDRAARQLVLVVDHRPPEPDRDAGSQNVAATIAALQQAGFGVKFWAEAVRDPDYVHALEQRGVEVNAGDPACFEAWLRQAGEAFDLVLLNRPHIAAAYLGPLHRHSGARVAFCGQDLHGRRLGMQAAIAGNAALAAEAARIEGLERWIWRSVDVSLYLSQEEAAIARALEPGARIAVMVPYCFPSFAAAREPPPSADLLFVGGFAHQPNQDAMRWFVDTVLTKVTARVPAARLVIAGSEMPQSILALAGELVAVLPDVPAGELHALHARARVSIAPLRFGAGVKLKVVEALREGTPLVTTPVGAQGLKGLADIAFVTDDADAFADRICALLEDDALWAARSAAQIAYARRHFDQRRFARVLLKALGLKPLAPIPALTRRAPGRRPPPQAGEADIHLSRCAGEVGVAQAAPGEGEQHQLVAQL